MKTEIFKNVDGEWVVLRPAYGFSLYRHEAFVFGSWSAALRFVIGPRMSGVGGGSIELADEWVEPNEDLDDGPYARRHHAN